MIANAGGLRVTVEVGTDGVEVRDAVQVPVERRLGLRGAQVPDGQALQVVSAEGDVLAVAKLPDEALHRTIIYPEGGGDGVKLERTLVQVDVPWPEGAAAVRIPGQPPVTPRILRAADPAGGARAGGVQAIPLLESGPASQRLDLVFVGDGYRAGELGDFAEDVDWIVDYLLTIQPYGRYSGLFNIWRIDVASAHSGVSHRESGITRDTAFGCYYGCGGLDRLICCDDQAVLRVVNSAIPGADGIMVLINDPQYGGSGGFNYATSYVGREFGHQVAAHELGHSLIGLWDEYGYGYDGSGEGPNCASSAEGSWDAWLGTRGVDAYQECSYNRLYRPTENGCMMRTLRDDYCPVCREEAVLAMYGRLPGLVSAVEPVWTPGDERVAIDAVEEEIVLTARVNGPDSGLVFEWLLDGEVVGNRAELPLTCSGLNGELSLRVYDDTAWVRSDPRGLLEETVGPWTVSSEECVRLLQDCEGCNQAGGAAGWPWLVALVALRRRRP